MLRRQEPDFEPTVLLGQRFELLSHLLELGLHLAVLHQLLAVVREALLSSRID